MPNIDFVDAFAELIVCVVFNLHKLPPSASAARNALAASNYNSSDDDIVSARSCSNTNNNNNGSFRDLVWPSRGPSSAALDGYPGGLWNPSHLSRTSSATSLWELLTTTNSNHNNNNNASNSLNANQLMHQQASSRATPLLHPSSSAYSSFVQLNEEDLDFNTSSSQHDTPITVPTGAAAAHHHYHARQSSRISSVSDFAVM